MLFGQGGLITSLITIACITLIVIGVSGLRLFSLH